MNFHLTKPCADCPFRSDKHFHLAPERAREICDAITERDQTFACHKTVDYSRSSGTHTPKTEHCAGALIMLEKLERPNQMMRIAERLNFYDRTKIDMAQPVYDTPDDMVEAMERGAR